jgi:GTPase
MKFIDETIIDVASGSGGAGSRSFRREKFVPMGGPDGGNGGRGGSVIVVADKNIQTLIDFKFKPLWQAGHGKSGSGRRKDGLSGEDLIIKLPIGTEIFNKATDELICDLTEEGQEFTIARGGRGGKGNVFFKSATNQAKKKEEPLELSAREYRLLKYLIGKIGDVVSRDELLDEVWGYNSYPTTRTVDNHIAKLRQKIEPNITAPRHILTIHGVGYKFVE